MGREGRKRDHREEEVRGGEGRVPPPTIE